eukprot:m.484519 g.484519  ORF g.484519 m.484519 type:complete len:416 (-) comp23402_c0_seq1:102-1349(-)
MHGDRLKQQRAGVFVDTMRAVGTPIRAVRGYQQPKADVRHANRYRRDQDDPETEELRGSALATATATLRHTGRQRQPKTVPTLRRETNASIQSTARITKAKAAVLRSVELEAGQELNALDRCSLALKQTLELPRRTVWLVGRCEHKRAQRPHQAPDRASELLAEERRVAQHCKAVLEQRLATTTALMQRVKRSRAALAEAIADNRRSLGLNHESYSVSVMRTPLPEEHVPACVVDAKALLKDAKRERRASNDAMEAARADLADLSSQVVAALRAAIKDHREIESKLHMATGLNRRTTHQAERQAHLLENARERNAGPTSGQWLTTAERHDRPMVRAHNSAVGRSPRKTTAREVDSGFKDGYRTFSKSLDQTTRDLKHNATVRRRLDEATHDRKYAKLLDEEVLRLRTKYAPGKRV